MVTRIFANWIKDSAVMGMKKYLLGIDNGNTVTKVSLFDSQGQERYVASRSAGSR
jgi:sugar (pentulose or hexulose) kinase